MDASALVEHCVSWWCRAYHMPQLSSDIRFLDLNFVWSPSEFNSSLDVCVVQFNPVNALIHTTVMCRKELNSVLVVFCVWLQIMMWIAWHGICLSCGETYQKIHWRLTRTSLYANTHPLVMMCGVEFKKIHSLLSTYYFCVEGFRWENGACFAKWLTVESGDAEQ